MKMSTSECIPIEYIKDQIEEYRKFDHLRMYAEFLDMFIQDYKDNAMANYADRKTDQTEPQIMYYPQVDGITPSVIQTEPKCATCIWLNHNNTANQCDNCVDGSLYSPKHTEPNLHQTCTKLAPNLHECYEPSTDCDTCKHWKYIAHEYQCEAIKCQGYEPSAEIHSNNAQGYGMADSSGKTDCGWK